jgi:hypothetical protein
VNEPLTILTFPETPRGQHMQEFGQFRHHPLQNSPF